MNPNNILSTITVLSIAAIVIYIAELFKEKEDEYEAPIGEPIPKPPDDRDRDERFKTKALDEDCSKDTDCSATGKFGGRESGPLDRIHCDKGRCKYDRKDWTDIAWFPPSKCVGKIFGKPDTCNVTSEENQLREKLKREGRYERFGR